MIRARRQKDITRRMRTTFLGAGSQDRPTSAYSLYLHSLGSPGKGIDQLRLTVRYALAGYYV